MSGAHNKFVPLDRSWRRKTLIKMASWVSKSMLGTEVRARTKNGWSRRRKGLLVLQQRVLWDVKPSRFDSELDKNGDASLNTEEILAWIIPSNEEIATDEVNNLLFQMKYSKPNIRAVNFLCIIQKVDHLFSGADEDGNEQLTFEEVPLLFAHYCILKPHHS